MDDAHIYTYPRHDKMASYMHNHQRRFVDMHTDQVQDIQRKLLEYTKLLQQPTEVAIPIDRPDLVIRTHNGLPVMPMALENGEQKKGELEDLIRRYLNAHYSKDIS